VGPPRPEGRLGALAAGARVNLERALRADARLDGHIVQGHVDGVGRVERLDRNGDDVRLYVACDAALAGLLVHKGSVAVDGVTGTRFVGKLWDNSLDPDQAAAGCREDASIRGAGA